MAKGYSTILATHTGLHLKQIYLCMYACVDVYMCMCVCMHACMDEYMCLHVCVCACMFYGQAADLHGINLTFSLCSLLDEQRH